MLRWPAGLDADAFLAQYWQRKPLLWRGALAPAVALIEDPDLMALAADEEIESRLITHHNESDWRLREGPFAAEELEQLPARDWSLLVQDVDKHAPRVAALLATFDFIPAWRRDDVMISLAAPGGSVGPHVDNYDVFLVQMTGARRWRWDRPAAGHEEHAEGGLRLIKTMPAEFDEVLAPGDILYLPPGAAHFGVATTSCSTYSIGFRAPSAADLYAAIGEVLQERGELSRRYADPDLDVSEVGAGLSTTVVQRALRVLPPGIDVDPELLGQALGRLVTEPKIWPDTEAAATPSWPELAAMLASGANLIRRPGSLFTWTEDAQACWLFVAGAAYAMQHSARPLVLALAQHTRFKGPELLAHCNTDETRELLLGLIADGDLYLCYLTGR